MTYINDPNGRKAPSPAVEDRIEDAAKDVEVMAEEVALARSRLARLDTRQRCRAVGDAVTEALLRLFDEQEHGRWHSAGSDSLLEVVPNGQTWRGARLNIDETTDTTTSVSIDLTQSDKAPTLGLLGNAERLLIYFDD